MAVVPFSFFTFVLIFSIVSNSGNCSNPKLFNVSMQKSKYDWSPARATWYGSPSGAGSNGGACGYGNTVEQKPFYSRISAGGPSLFKSGKGCGACYEVKCTTNPACSWNPVTVVITDECPECVSESVHFDLSGTAFGAMASSGTADQLRNAGVLQIQYRKVLCNYPGTKMAFRVDSGSNPYYFATLIEYASGDGQIGFAELKQAETDSWLPMQQSWGQVWKLNSNSGSPLRAPFSIKLTTLDSGKNLVASDVIPAGWQPGKTYWSKFNFS